MPIYEFLCTPCEKEFELMCPMGTEIKDVKCPSCGKSQLVRKLSLFAGAGRSDDFSDLGDFSGGDDSEESPGGGCGSCGPSGCGCG